MRLLIVHREAEIGEALVAMVRDYTQHAAHFAASAEEALASAERESDLQLLITQVEAEGIDGFAIAASLGEQFPHLKTFFLPAYSAAAQRLEITRTKIFPEPIEGELLLQAIEQVAAAPDAPDVFHLIDLLQMCCLSGKSGAVQLVADEESGVVYLRNGELRHAETARTAGWDALYEMLRWGPVQFAYDATADPVEQTIDIGWDAALVELVMREREERALEAGGSSEPEISAALLPPEPDLTGRDFGNYRVGPKLTESFWDKVYEAEQTSVGRAVALHVLRNTLRADPQRAREFLETASVNANIRHPAILPVYEAGELDGTYFYAREFVVGRTVYEIRAGGLTISELVALRLVHAIAAALAHLEARGILHAPLRLSRIFVTPNDEAKLADVAVADPAIAQSAPPEAEIRTIGRLLIPMIKPSAVAGGGRVLNLIHRMQTSGGDALASWPAVAEEARKIEAAIAPPLLVPPTNPAPQKRKLWGKRG